MAEGAGPGLEALEGGATGFAGRPPAWSEDAEVSVLGAMLIDGDAVARAVEILGDGDGFYKRQNQLVYNALRRLHERDTTPNVVALEEELKASGDLEAVGGLESLAELIDAVPTATNVQADAKIVAEKATLRRLQEVCRDVVARSFEAGPGQTHEVVTDALERVREVEGQLPETEGPRTVREILEDPEFGASPAIVADKLAWAGRLTLFAGREKSGKSTVLRWAVARRSQGERVWGGVTVGGPMDVLYYGEEHGDDVAADLQRLGADIDRVRYRDMRVIAGDRITALSRDVDAVEPDMVVVDTLPRIAAPREPESGASADWEPIMGELGALAVRSDAGVVLNHHATKADGSYRDSTAIGAGVDCILEMRRSAEGESNRREVSAYPRAAIRVSDFAYVKVGTDDDPRLELVDESLPLKERVRRFVERNEPCSQRAVRDGVTGRAQKVKAALQGLYEAGTLNRDETAGGYRYTIAETPHGTGTEPPRNRFGTAGTGNGGGGGSENPPLPRKGEGVRNRPAEPVDDDGGENTDGQEPNVCSSYDCDRRIGPTSEVCGTCKREGAA